MASASPAPNPTPKANVVPSEVGWQFVPQYYTFVNKQPHRLHCFYTKHSTYVHGVEGEDLKPCHGQQANCKVFIHSVDAQSSAAGGIIIQVIGEMSNAGEPWRKFAQTFFLAEQPNGYFVLNDIFRYLKEESNADDEAEAEEDATPNGETAVPEPVPAPQTHDVAEPVAIQPEPTPAPAPAPQEAPVVAPEPVAEEPAVNGTHVEESKPAEPAKEAAQLPSPSPEPEAQPAEEPTPVELTPAREQTPAPAAAAPAPAPAPAPTEKPQPPAPSAPPAAAPSPAPLLLLHPKHGRTSRQPIRPTGPPPKPAAPAPPRKEEPPIDTSNMSPQAQAAMSVSTALCFIKLNDWVRDQGPGTPTANSAESVSPAALREVLTTRFGAIKELEVVRNKACAFLEFQTVESARRAILASLPTNQGGEGGIRIGEDTPNERAPRITVEMRKERADRPASGRPPRTGGGPEPRGSFRGRGRGRGDGTRGGVPQAAK
ncbi:nuclear transport factor 2 [Ceratobasidium sp. AG-Ba]|nr:nuclear transport factor 2 [Ceratobasidium sp. AG-Ba]